MSQFLLPCPCGAKIPVSRSQAGMSLPCPQCSSSLDVPKIRDFATLEPVTSISSNKVGSNSPSRLFGALAAIFFVVALVCLSYGGYLAYLRLTFPIPLDKTEADYVAEIKAEVLQYPPANVWDTWNELSETGLVDPDPPTFFLFQRAFRERDPLMYSLLSVGGASLLAFGICGWLARSKPQRT